MEIKLIEDKDFMQLADLTVEMYQSINKNITALGAVNTLMAFINGGQDYLAIGLYDGPVLLGFAQGNRIHETAFYWSGFYMSVKNTEWTEKLIDYCFDFIKERGYKSWELDATNPNIGSMMKKYGAKVKFTRYHKELE